MDINNLFTFIAVATLLVISPGPNGFLIAKTVPISGRRAGFANVWGFIVAFYIHGTLSIFGISILLVQSAQAFMVFKLIGAAYLVWIGVKALFNAFRGADVSSSACHQKAGKMVSLKTAFYEGFLTNMLNPKVSMFYLAAFPQFISVGDNVLNAYALISAHVFINFVWFSLMVIALARVKSVATNERFKKWINAMIGVVFIGFGSKLALMQTE